MAKRPTASLATMCGFIACGALLGASGYRASTASGAPEFVPIVATAGAQSKAQLASPLMTGRKMILLSGAAALRYLYKKHRNEQFDGLNGRYYLSKDGRVYYRDAQHRARFISPPRQPIAVPEGEAREYAEYQGKATMPNDTVSPRMSTHVAAAGTTTPAWKTTPDGFAPLSYFAANCARCHGPNGSFYGPSFAKMHDDAALRQIVHDMAFGPAQAPIDDARLEVLTAYNRSLIDRKPFLSLSSVTSGSLYAIPETSKTDVQKPSANRKPAKGNTSKRGPMPKVAPSKAAASDAASSKTTLPNTPSKGFDPRFAGARVWPPKNFISHRDPSTPITILQGEATPDARVTLIQNNQTVQAERKGDTWKATLPGDWSAGELEITAEKDGFKTTLQPIRNAWSHAAPPIETKPSSEPGAPKSGEANPAAANGTDAKQ